MNGGTEMKKSSFTAMILGTGSAVLFALGMCMALLQEWNAFVPGIVLGAAGIVLGIITLLVWRKMEHKAPVKLNGKTFLITVIAVAGALILGAGMCLCMVWDNLILGVCIGLAGIIVLLSLIPVIKGIK